MRTSLFVALLVGATFLGTGLRLYDLAAPSLWTDELFTIRDAIMTGGPGYRSTRIGLQLSGVAIDQVGPEAYHTFASHGINEWNMRIGSCALGAWRSPSSAFSAPVSWGAALP